MHAPTAALPPPWPAPTVAAGALLVGTMLWDAFETVILPRRVNRAVRASRALQSLAWSLWRAAGRRMQAASRRERTLSYFGPLSLVGLLLFWALGLVVGYGLVFLGLGTGHALDDSLFLSGSTFTTVGIAGLGADPGAARLVAVLEAGTALGFLAVVISYLPLLHQTFSRRESQLVMLDEWAGSPPTAGALLHRLGQHPIEEVTAFLEQWERWSAEILESHLSYPVLAFFRSQHDNQSWVAALTTILDVSAIAISGYERTVPYWPARRAFAIGRHAAVDLCQVLGVPPMDSGWRRSVTGDGGAVAGLHEALGARATAEGTSVVDRRRFVEELATRRELYEPYVGALAQHLLMAMPPLVPGEGAVDSWQSTARTVPRRALRSRRSGRPSPD